jgi:hypothetical protein
MVVYADAESLRDAVNGTLECRIVERDQAAAAIAHEMVVVLAAGECPLEPREVTPDAHPLNQPMLDQQLEDAVDRGTTDPGSLGSELVLDLDGTQRAWLLRQQVDDPFPSSATPQPGMGKDGMNMLGPRRRIYVKARRGHVRRSLASASDETRMSPN